MMQPLQNLNDTNNTEEALGIEVTSACNAACLHCFVRSAAFQKSYLPYSMVKQIIREGYDASFRRLHITGGEPLLWKDLIPALDHAFELGYKKALINSNGSLLTRDVNHRLSAYEGLSVSISLDGPETFHDSIRGKGSYKRTISRIENALDAGLNLFIFTTVCRTLLPDLMDFVHQISQRFPRMNGLTLIQLIRVMDHHFALSQELLDPDDFLRLVQSISLLNLFGLKTYLLRSPLLTVASRLLRTPWIPQPYPMYRYGSIFVLASGDIALTHSHRIGFCRYESGIIKRILASESYRKAVGPDSATCPTCEYVELCRECGMIRPSEPNVDMYPDVPYCQRVIRRLLQGLGDTLNPAH